MFPAIHLPNNVRASLSDFVINLPEPATLMPYTACAKLFHPFWVDEILRADEEMAGVFPDHWEGLDSSRDLL